MIELESDMAYYIMAELNCVVLYRLCFYLFYLWYIIGKTAVLQ